MIKAETFEEILPQVQLWGFFKCSCTNNFHFSETGTSRPIGAPALEKANFASSVLKVSPNSLFEFFENELGQGHQRKTPHLSETRAGRATEAFAEKRKHFRSNFTLYEHKLRKF